MSTNNKTGLQVHFIFRFKPEATIDAIKQATAGIDKLLQKNPGFVGRQLLRPEGDGHWVDMVQWKDAASSEAASAGFMGSKEGQSYLGLIDNETLSNHRVIPLT